MSIRKLKIDSSVAGVVPQRKLLKQVTPIPLNIQTGYNNPNSNLNEMQNKKKLLPSVKSNSKEVVLLKPWSNGHKLSTKNDPPSKTYTYPTGDTDKIQNKGIPESKKLLRQKSSSPKAIMVPNVARDSSVLPTQKYGSKEKITMPAQLLSTNTKYSFQDKQEGSLKESHVLKQVKMPVIHFSLADQNKKKTSDSTMVKLGAGKSKNLGEKKKMLSPLIGAVRVGGELKKKKPPESKQMLTPKQSSLILKSFVRVPEKWNSLNQALQEESDEETRIMQAALFPKSIKVNSKNVWKSPQNSNKRLIADHRNKGLPRNKILNGFLTSPALVGQRFNSSIPDDIKSTLVTGNPAQVHLDPIHSFNEISLSTPISKNQKQVILNPLKDELSVELQKSPAATGLDELEGATATRRWSTGNLQKVNDDSLINDDSPTKYLESDDEESNLRSLGLSKNQNHFNMVNHFKKMSANGQKAGNIPIEDNIDITESNYETGGNGEPIADTYSATNKHLVPTQNTVEDEPIGYGKPVAKYGKEEDDFIVGESEDDKRSDQGRFSKQSLLSDEAIDFINMQRQKDAFIVAEDTDRDDANNGFPDDDMEEDGMLRPQDEQERFSIGNSKGAEDVSSYNDEVMAFSRDSGGDEDDIRVGHHQVGRRRGKKGISIHHHRPHHKKRGRGSRNGVAKRTIPKYFVLDSGLFYGDVF